MHDHRSAIEGFKNHYYYSNLVWRMMRVVLDMGSDWISSFIFRALHFINLVYLSLWSPSYSIRFSLLFSVSLACSFDRCVRVCVVAACCVYTYNTQRVHTILGAQDFFFAFSQFIGFANRNALCVYNSFIRHSYCWGIHPTNRFFFCLIRLMKLRNQPNVSLSTIFFFAFILRN